MSELIFSNTYDVSASGSASFHINASLPLVTTAPQLVRVMVNGQATGDVLVTTVYPSLQLIGTEPVDVNAGQVIVEVYNVTADPVNVNLQDDGLSLSSGENTSPEQSYTPQMLDPVLIDENMYSELPGSPKESVSAKSLTCTRELLCKWEDRIELVKKFMGYIQVVGNQVIIQMPQFWPAFAYCYVHNVKSEPFDQRPMPDSSLSFAKYKMAKLTVEYSTPEEGEKKKNDKGDDIWISEEIEPHGEFLTLPSDKFFWQDKTKITEAEAPQRIVRTFKWVFTRYKMSEIPSWMFDFIGTVNKDTIRSLTLGYIFKPETLLFDEPRLSRDWTAAGPEEWKVTMVFVYRPWTWNKFFRAGKKDPEFLYVRKPVAGHDPKNDDPNEQYPDQYYTYEIFKPYDQNNFLVITGA